MMKTSTIFNYLRGAIRGAYGEENLRGRSILIEGVGDLGKELIMWLGFNPEVNLYFHPSVYSKMKDYFNAFSACPHIQLWEGQTTDVVVDTEALTLTVDGTTLGLVGLGQDSYTQGIHDFYC